jgi:hypothetical protein
VGELRSDPNVNSTKTTRAGAPATIRTLGLAFAFPVLKKGQLKPDPTQPKPELNQDLAGGGARATQACTFFVNPLDERAMLKLTILPDLFP